MFCSRRAPLDGWELVKCRRRYHHTARPSSVVSSLPLLTRLSQHNHTHVLVRKSQITSIISELVKSGKWKLAELHPRPLDLQPPAGVPLLESTGDDNEPYSLSFWTESDYHLSVDNGAMIEVPDCRALNTVLIQEDFHPDRERLGYGPRLTTSRGVQFLWPLPARSKKQMTPFLVPTVPALIDAFLDQARWLEENLPDSSMAYRPLIHVENMIRYLYLEEPHQKKALLPQLAPRHHQYILERLRRYKRKQTVMLVGGELRTLPKGSAMYNS